MKKIYVYFTVLACGLFLTAAGRAENSGIEKELSKEDHEIIENLEFFENFEILEEDEVLIEEYDDIDKITFLGENNE